MLGLRNLYRAFRESRETSRKRATLTVTGATPETEDLSTLLNAAGATGGVADVTLAVSRRLGGDGAGGSGGGVEVSFSGGAVEEPETVALSAVTEAAVRAELAPRVAAALDEDYLVPLGRGYPLLRGAACEEIVRKNARQNAVVGALPIPGADMPAITANQARMVLNIAAVYGEELTMERARELLGVLAAGLGLRAVSRQVLKLIPVAGWAASGAVGYAGTIAMGRAAILYFERGGRGPSPAERSGIARRAQEEARAFLSSLRR